MLQTWKTQKGCNTCTREYRSACVLQGVSETLMGSVSLWCEVTTSSSQVTIPRIVTEDWFLGRELTRDVQKMKNGYLRPHKPSELSTA